MLCWQSKTAMTQIESFHKENWLNSPPDDDTTLCVKLAKMISLGESIAFHLAVCNDAHQRESLMRQVEDFLPSQHAQRLRVPKTENNLIRYLRRSLENPSPQAVFVYGLEDWLFGKANHHANTFLLNLNATRDSFRLDYQGSLVLWVPEYVLRTLMDGAPDFLSTVSGRYIFSKVMQVQGDALAGTLNDNNAGMAAELNSQAMQYYAQGRYSEAIPLLEEALKIRRKALPEGHPDIANSLNNLAGLYKSQGRSGEAEPLYDEALKIFRKALPEGHPNIASSLNNLAGLYESQGRSAEAEPLYDEALKIFCKALPEGHPNIAISLNNLAGLYESQGRSAEAEPLYNEALKICRKALPEGHPNIAQSLNNLAYLYNSQGRSAEAEPLLEEALEILRKALGDNHPNTKVVAENLRLFRQQANTS